MQINGMYIASTSASAIAIGTTNENEQLLYLSSSVGGEGVQLLVESSAMHNSIPYSLVQAL